MLLRTDDEDRDGLLEAAAEYTCQGHAALSVGEVHAAERCYLSALALEIRAGHVAGQAADWRHLAVAKERRGAVRDAIRCLGRAFRLHSRSEDRAALAADLSNLADLLAAQGRWERAACCLARAAAAFEELRRPVEAREVLSRLAACRRVLRVRVADPAVN